LNHCEFAASRLAVTAISEEKVMNKSDLTSDTIEGIESDSQRRDELAPHKKKFLTPEISVPTDVLEATTFFQVADSGSTN